MGMNVFNSGGTAFLGPEPFAFDRAAMLAGNPATFITFRDPSFFNPTSDQFMPADLDGLNPPPAGAPNPFMSTGTNATWPLYHFHVDFAVPTNSTFTLDATLTPTPFSVIHIGLLARSPYLSNSVRQNVTVSRAKARIPRT